MAHVVAINRSEQKGTIKQPIPDGKFIVDFGLEGDAHAGNWHRQVSLLGVESIHKMELLGIKGLCSGNFAENITTEGIVLYEIPVGTRFRIGPCLMEVTQIGKECHKHCAIYHKIGSCIMPTEGIFAKVLEGGVIRPQDTITLVEAP